jgi:lysophospholipase L1-like esterase
VDRPRRWRHLLPVLAVAAWVLLAFGLGVASRAWDPLDRADEAAAGLPASSTTPPSSTAASPTTRSTLDGAGVAEHVAPGDGPGSRTTDGQTATTIAEPQVRLPDRVIVVGDSLTVGSEDGFVFRLGAGGYDVVVDARVSRATVEGVRRLEDLEPTPDDLVVVALGTNDALSPTEFSTAVDRMLAAAGGAPVLWIDIDRPGYERLNEVLERADDEGRLTIVRWTSVIDAHGNLRSGDHVHLSREGYDLRAQVVAEAVICAVQGCDALQEPVVDTTVFDDDGVFDDAADRALGASSEGVTPAGASAADRAEGPPSSSAGTR